MRKPLLALLLTCLSAIPGLAQLKIVQKSLTDLHVTVNSASQVVTQPDAKILVLGTVAEGRNYKTALVRFDSTGKLDKTFGSNGIDTFTATDFFPGYEIAFFNALALQNDKIIIGGAAEFYSNVSQGNAILMRFTTTGKVDSSFGKKGIVVTNTFSGTGISIDEIKSIAIDGLNRICVAGRTYDYVKYRFLAGRYKPNGQPDSSFLYNGVTTFNIGTLDDEALDIKIRPGNGILILGKTYSSRLNYEVALLALNTDGTKDASFGNKGVAVTIITAGSDIANVMVLQPDKKIVCVGNSANNLLAVRFKTNGTPDSSFAQDGKLIMDIGFPGCVANGVAIQPGGNIVVGGRAKKDSYNHFFTLRMLKNGHVDSSYARNGILFNSVYGSNDMAAAMAMLPDGRVIQAGVVTHFASTLIGVFQSTVNGRADISFGTRGAVALGIGSSKDVAFKMVKVPWDNSFLLCGTANQYWSLVKYNANKSLGVDKSFGVNGVVTVPYSDETDQFAEPNVAVDSALKRIYMCGLDGYDFCIFCFKSDGSVDTSFGQNGVVHYPDIYLYYGGLAVTAKHKIVFPAIRFENGGEGSFIAMLNEKGEPEQSFGTNGVVADIPQNLTSVIEDKRNSTLKFGGLVVVNDIYDAGICVLSIKENGKYDNSFGQNGSAVLKINNGSAQVYYKYSLAIDAYGGVIVSGAVQLYDTFGYFFALARFTRNGLPDATFGNNGLVITSPGDIYRSNPSNEGVAVASIDRKHYYIVTAGTEMDSYYKTAKSVVAVYKNDGSLDTLTKSTLYWNKSLFGGDFESAYGAYIDDVTPLGYTLYIAGTGGRGNTQDFGLVQFNKFNGEIIMHIGSIDYVKAATVSIYPNPAHNYVTISCLLPEEAPVYIGLIDPNGKTIQQYQFANNLPGQFKQTIQLPAGLSAGLYFIKLTNGKRSITEKLVKE